MVHVSIKNQYITYEEFKEFSQNFLRKSKILNYQWEWIEEPKNKKGFLKLIQYSEISKDKLNRHELLEDDDEIYNIIINKNEYNEIQLKDEGVLTEDSNDIKIFWEWHIVYSSVFQVPTLFFNAWDEEHNPIDILNNRDIFPIKPLNTPIITQKDHPILGIPYYYIHPCTTGQNMNKLYNIEMKDQLTCSMQEVDTIGKKENSLKDLSNDDIYNNYIASWLSTTGFLKVDIKYFLL
ncbi:hypothetical protein BCR36DRAFT_581032 [Piromyces finnis]|uniref:Ubiquitin-like-conjugating enzyme ATG10 n=1 Tax=Piromyces finnis TaxID=1754191 RepID=A0A1Y1VGU0_9FUNG|nr:hypothetical protein BCR36DRAFT_581032 [Piromyces finnis]|eukprot:ORX55870.1 hypothetical protein BCR36DRAFT_581032 [Piromyces finnis]